ncbi:putative Transmembrane protein [Quillaja saponaria]|uniref:Transmembrane protein n=1 Tax=Quillaja saponaria TaxID=32244 RepID=A0AAD7LJX6_QUISA|nr:putative Transmembrane protein [Quillaja saponaria]
MAVTVKQMSLIVSLFGVLSFILGIVAENKKPASGTPIDGKGVVICKYPSDPTVALGYLSVAFLAVSTVAGYLSLFYPYKGKAVPQKALFQSTSFVVFFNIALLTTGLAATLLLWPTITEQLHLARNVHHNLKTDCPTAKTGLLGGGAFLSLDSALFWLVALMLADNAREDFFDEEDNQKGEYGNVPSNDYDAHLQSKASA